MATTQAEDFTRILNAAQAGDESAGKEVFTVIYHELRRLASARMAQEAAGHTLQPTALVHEAWLRLAGKKDSHWQSHLQFVAAAAEAMRHILIDNARRKSRIRHGKGLIRVNLDCVDLASQADEDTLLRVDEALKKLAVEDPVKAQLVKLRYFVGLSIPEAANALGLSESTAKRAWSYARAWLYAELKNGIED